MYIYKYNKNITNTVNHVPARVRTQPYTPASDNGLQLCDNNNDHTRGEDSDDVAVICAQVRFSFLLGCSFTILIYSF